jgi:sec-independent protein translocase protein TatC
MADKITLLAPGYIKHLAVLRYKLLSVAAAVALLTVLCFIFITPIINIIQMPVSGLKVQLNYFTPYEKFMVYMKIAFFAAVFISMPYVIFQAGHFIYPALKKKERPYFFLFTALVPAMFLLGIIFGYFVLVPAAFRFFINFSAGDNVRPIWGIDQYFSLIISMLCMSGVIFQVPLPLVFLMKTGLIKPETLEKYRKHIIVLIAVTAGIFTPPDAMSMILMSVPLYLLFELSIIIGKRVVK